MAQTREAATGREQSWPVERLVRECREGNQAAWSALIDKYKNLIFSVPIKFGLSREDAADIFQAVCLDLLTSLARLREPAALPKWLMQTSYHKCLRWKKQRLDTVEDVEEVATEESLPAELPEEFLYQLQRKQLLRDSLAALSARCRRMIQMLFFEDPPRPYNEVARELRLATGSIGFIRGRCLKRLREQLVKGGLT
ncbi:MAG TPA: sigma-70 family RNA polymerase sigma factor [Terriglobales bacterium]|nr:sigma-70 family RNA polymerase sigma factor [Terriglobales bacterium]